MTTDQKVLGLNPNAVTRQGLQHFIIPASSILPGIYVSIIPVLPYFFLVGEIDGIYYAVETFLKRLLDECFYYDHHTIDKSHFYGSVYGYLSDSIFVQLGSKTQIRIFVLHFICKIEI